MRLVSAALVVCLSLFAGYHYGGVSPAFLTNFITPMKKGEEKDHPSPSPLGATSSTGGATTCNCPSGKMCDIGTQKCCSITTACHVEPTEPRIDPFWQCCTNNFCDEKLPAEKVDPKCNPPSCVAHNLGSSSSKQQQLSSSSASAEKEESASSNPPVVFLAAEPDCQKMFGTTQPSGPYKSGGKCKDESHCWVYLWTKHNGHSETKIGCAKHNPKAGSCFGADWRVRAEVKGGTTFDQVTKEINPSFSYSRDLLPGGSQTLTGCNGAEVKLQDLYYCKNKWRGVNGQPSYATDSGKTEWFNVDIDAAQQELDKM